MFIKYRVLMFLEMFTTAAIMANIIDYLGGARHCAECFIHFI